MSIKVAAPRPYWDDPSGPVQEFKTWFTLFNGWLEIQNLDRTAPLTDYQKNNLLLLTLGSEGMKVFHSNPAMEEISSKSYADFSMAVKETFIIPVNPVRAHYDLFHRRQQGSETVSEFLSSLRALMADCSFCVNCSKLMLATMLVVGCNNTETQGKLLTERAIDFDKFISVLKAEESAREASSHLQACGSQVNKVSKYPNQKGNKGKNARDPESEEQRTKKQKVPSFHKLCGTVHERYKCPMSKCYNCQKPGHIARDCRESKQDKSQQASRSGRVSMLSLTVGSATSTQAYMCTVTASIGNDSLTYEAEVDSGADITTITETQYKQAFKDIALSALPPSVNIRNFDKSPIPIIGTFKAKVEFQSRSAQLTIYVVTKDSHAVLGKDAIHALRLQLSTESFTVSAAKADVPSAFAKYPSLTAPGIGKFPGYKHTIKLRDDAVPKVAKLRPVALTRREAVSKEIQAMVDMDIWERCDKTDWVHGLVVVPKPNPNEVRITTDLSPLNKYIVPNHHPMPTAQDLFLRMRGCVVFTRLDLTKAYFHIELDEESRPLTATITQDGVFQYKRTPMGMMDSGNVFQELVEKNLKGIDRMAVSVDDVLIGGTDEQDLEKRTDIVLERLASKNFRVNPDKCEFKKMEVTYLGHVISADGIKPNPRRVSAITDAPPPTNLKELQSFLGFCNYYCAYVHTFGNSGRAFAEVDQEGYAIQDAACEDAFREIKARIASDALTAIFDPEAATILSTDASSVGLGAVLSQVQKGKEVPIAFASRTLQPSERNYAANEAEALACVWGCEHFEKFLLSLVGSSRSERTMLHLKHCCNGTAPSGKPKSSIGGMSA